MTYFFVPKVCELDASHYPYIDGVLTRGIHRSMLCASGDSVVLGDTQLLLSRWLLEHATQLQDYPRWWLARVAYPDWKGDGLAPLVDHMGITVEFADKGGIKFIS